MGTVAIPGREITNSRGLRLEKSKERMDPEIDTATPLQSDPAGWGLSSVVSCFVSLSPPLLP